MPRSAVSRADLADAVRHRAAVLLHAVYRPARLLVELAESTIFAEADNEVLGAAEELEPIRCVGGWHRAGVRMRRLGRALCKQQPSTASGGRQFGFDPAQKRGRTERIVCSAKIVVQRSQRLVLFHQRAVPLIALPEPLLCGRWHCSYGSVGIGPRSGLVWMGARWEEGRWGPAGLTTGHRGRSPGDLSRTRRNPDIRPADVTCTCTFFIRKHK
jgi:hypothetical protein